MYAADGAMMAPGAPIAQGQPALEKAWGGLMQMPGFALTFKADKIEVASGGDMALDRGTYLLTLGGPKGETKEVGKYVVVWRNVDGQWKVAADIFNSDGASAPLAWQVIAGGAEPCLNSSASAARRRPKRRS